MKKRIALLGIYHESNTFVSKKTTLEDFKKGRYLKGEAIREEYESAHHEIGGMIEVVDQDGFELIPVMYAETTPSGTITADTFDVLQKDMMEELEKVLPVDGILVVPHGAGVSEAHPDMDGYWLKELRNRVGNDTPIVGTLDLHANVSPLMVSSTDALVSYRKNPHIDQRQRGIEAARLLVDRLDNQIELSQVLVQVPVAISIEQQLTTDEPCKSLYAKARGLSDKSGVLSISLQLGFPYADVDEMGTSIIVVSDGRPKLACQIARELSDYIVDTKQSFIGSMLDARAAVNKIEESEKPVLLLDMGDNIGGGSPGNNICLLEAMEEKNKHPYFVCIYDPAAVQNISNHKIKDYFSIEINGTNGEDQVTYPLEVKLEKITDGNFQEDNPRHGGQVNYKMGRTVIVKTQNDSVIMFNSKRTPPFSLQQLVAFDINPKKFDAIVAKGVNAPIAAYASMCPTIIQVDTPGVTQADMTMFDYQHRRKPLFPFEQKIKNELKY